MSNFGDTITGKFFVPSDGRGVTPKFGFYRNSDDEPAFAKNGVRVGGFPLRSSDVAAISVLRMGSLNLLDFIVEGETYINDAFVRAQTALLTLGLRELYVPGNRTYLLDPAKPEIQLVLDDLRLWSDSAPLFYHSTELQGFFQVLYANNVTIEGVRTELDPTVTRQYLSNPSGGFVGNSYNSRKSGIFVMDSDDFSASDIQGRNHCNLIRVQGYHTGTALAAWKALSPAARITTPFSDFIGTDIVDDPDLASSLRRAGGQIKLENLTSDHNDFGVLYDAIEDISVYDVTGTDTTETDIPAHLIYGSGNIAYNEMTNERFRDRSNGTGKIAKIKDHGNPLDASGKFRIHENLTITDWHAKSVTIGLTLINNDGMKVDGVEIEDLFGVLRDDATEGYGGAIYTYGCRDGVVQNVKASTRGGVQHVRAIWHRETRGDNQRRETDTGELHYSRNMLYRNITIKTNYADHDQNRDFDPSTFDPSTIADEVVPLFQAGDDGGICADGMTFENCEHVDAWGHYPGSMFYFIAGSSHRVVTPRRLGTASLAEIFTDSNSHVFVLDPATVETTTIVDAGTPASRVILLGPSIDHPGLLVPDDGPSAGLANRIKVQGAAAGSNPIITTDGEQGDLSAISFGRIIRPPTFTPDTLPGADLAPGGIAYVNDASPFWVGSNGTTWYTLGTTALGILDETQAIIDEGWTPSDDVKYKADNCIRSLKYTGLWDKILAMWGATSLLNWKDPTANAMVAVGSPSFSADDYFAGGGTDADYFETSLDLSTGGGGTYTLNSASLWRYSATDFSGDLSADMGTGTTCRIQGRQAGGTLAARGNSSASVALAVADSLGLAGWTRTNSSTVSIFKDDAIVKTDAANASTSVSATTLKIGRADAGNASSRHLNFAGVGGALTATDIANLNAILTRYLT